MCGRSDVRSKRVLELAVSDLRELMGIQSQLREIFVARPVIFDVSTRACKVLNLIRFTKFIELRCALSLLELVAFSNSE